MKYKSVNGPQESPFVRLTHLRYMTPLDLLDFLTDEKISACPQNFSFFAHLLSKLLCKKFISNLLQVSQKTL